MRNVKRQYGNVDSPNHIQCWCTEDEPVQPESLNTCRCRTYVVQYLPSRTYIYMDIHTYKQAHALMQYTVIYICVSAWVPRLGINQSVHWSGPQYPYHYMHRAFGPPPPPQPLTASVHVYVSHIKRIALLWRRVFLDVCIRTSSTVSFVMDIRWRIRWFDMHLWNIVCTITRYKFVKELSRYTRISLIVHCLSMSRDITYIWFYLTFSLI